MAQSRNSSAKRVTTPAPDIVAVSEAVFLHRIKGLQATYGIIKTPVGRALVCLTQGRVCWLSFDTELPSFCRALTYSSEEAATLLAPFFNKAIIPPLLLWGTLFQHKVWQALLKVPFSTTITYQSLAQQLEKPNAWRAVGTAVGKNPIAWLVPCHRVLPKGDTLGNYRWGQQFKKALLDWEQ